MCAKHFAEIVNSDHQFCENRRFEFLPVPESSAGFQPADEFMPLVARVSNPRRTSADPASEAPIAEAMGTEPRVARARGRPCLVVARVSNPRRTSADPTSEAPIAEAMGLCLVWRGLGAARAWS